MDDQSRPAESHDPRIDAALHEYLERVDRGEMLDPHRFVAEHEEIADELRSLIDAEVELRNLAPGGAHAAGADTSTRSFALHGQETIPPQAQSKLADGSSKGGLKEQFGRYRIVKVLGQGAMGTVYLAEDTQLKRQVALKTPHFDTDPSGELLERLYREARAAATLRHPNICPVHDVGEIDGTHYISMAYIEGHPLSAFVRSSKPQPERQTLIVVRKLAQALQEAHDQKVVHRDLKPANIMVDKRGEPLIMDFGLARHTRPDEDVRLTHSGTLVGTPAYMAPEQVDADASKIGPLTDEYSLGVILYELLTGQLPFRGSMMAVLGQIVMTAPTPPSQLRPGLDPRIEAACLKMMAKNPSDRFPSLKAVADELASILKNPGARPAATAKAAGSSTLPAATDMRTASSAGSSKILNSQTLKALTGSDLESLEELARKCWSRHDYDQVIQIAERIPEPNRNAALQTLLEQARAKADEISFLICDIDEAVRLEDGPTALKKADALLKVKPGHHRALEIQEQFGGWGEGGIVRLGPQRVAQAWREGGWIPWSALAFGIAVVGVVAGVIIIWMGKAALVIETDDAGVEVAVKGVKTVITVPGKQSITIEPGEHEFSVSYAGLETVTKSFKLTKGQTQRLKVEILDGKLRAQLQGEILPLIAESEKAKGGGGAPESKAPAAVASTAPVSAANAPTSRDGFVPMFNGRDLTGWKTLAEQPGHWRVEQGVLIGSGSELSHLCTEREDFADFHLRVEARLNQGGDSGVYFRVKPPVAGNEPRFPEGYEAQIVHRKDKPQTGSLFVATRVAAVSINEPPVPAGEWFTLEVMADGNHFVVKINGKTTADYVDEKRRRARGRLALQQYHPETVAEFRKIEIRELPPSALATPAGLTPAEGTSASVSADGFRPLFNGIDKTGWKIHPSQPADWRVEKGILIGSGAKRSYLYTERGNFKDFHLRVEARINDGGNSGLYFRSTFGLAGPVDQRQFAYGYEAQIDSTVDPNRTGSLFAGGQIVVGVSEMLVPAGEWFTEEVIAEGNHFVVKVNGRTTAIYRDEKELSATGHIALQLNNAQTVAEFRKIEIKELGPSIASATGGATRTSRPADKDALIAPFNESQAQAAQQKWSERLKTPVELTNKLKMRLRLIPPGQFQMGANAGPDFVQPAHAVQITRPFYLGTYEVTRAQFGTFIANHPKTSSEYHKTGWRIDNNGDKMEKWEPRRRFTWQSPGFAQDGTHPAIDVSWDDVQEFCAWLSKSEGKKYRLPTEAEWEYACRAGTTAPRYNGGRDEEMTKIGNFADATAKEKFSAWHTLSTSDGFVYTAPVGQFLPNNFGLSDTLGNVMEWCSDWYDESYYKRSPDADPQGPSGGKQRVARGGSFVSWGDAAGRWRFNSNHRSPSMGFRVVCEIPEPPPVAEATAAITSTGNGTNPHAWIGSDSRFDEISPDKWRETFPKQPGHAIFFFDVVARTPGFLELIDKTRIKSKGGVSVRLGDDQALMRWGGPGKEFKPLQRGHWATLPTNPGGAAKGL